ncbi:MAG: DUF4252 domain-containing protein [Flavobacteriales bacterium]|nr:DUF4252 domain-containing protein [Flavobacteriales bacterium]
MKKILFSIFILSFPLLMAAQPSQVEKLFDQYSGKEGYTSVHITKYMFEMFAKVATEEEDNEFKEVTSQLTAIKILTLDSETNAKRGQDFYKEINNSLSEPEYKDLMIVKDGGEEIKFMIKETKDIISELVMIIGGENEGVLISLMGDIDLKTISKISKSMDLKGLKHLDKVDEKNN